MRLRLWAAVNYPARKDMELVERSLATPDVGRLPTIMPSIAKRHWFDSPDKFGGKVFIHKVTRNKSPAVLS